MQKRVAFVGLISAGLVLGAGLGKATTINDTGNANVATANLKGPTNSFTLTSDGTNPGGTLTVGGTNIAVELNGNNPSTSTVLNTGTISQTGNVSGSTSPAITDEGGGQTNTITNGSTNNSTATIEATDDDAINLNHGSNNETINNYGQLLSLAGGQGIDMSGMHTVPSSGSANTTINNFSTGLIEGEANDGIQTAVGGIIYNDGRIIGVGSSSDAINAGSNSGLAITNSDAFLGDTSNTGTITGGHHGITGGNTGTLNGTAATSPTTSVQLGSYLGTGSYTMTITNNTGGTITGSDGSGINIDGFGIQGTQIAGTSNFRNITNESVTVTNHGTITGYGADRDGDGIDVDGVVTVDNFGTIQSENAVPEAGDSGPEFSEGITVGGGSITNELGATIHGYVQSGNTQGVGRGITLAGIDKAANDTSIPLESIYANSTITNSGLIQGGTGPGNSGGESGIAVLGTTGGGYTVTITNNSTGTIEGNNTGVSERGTDVLNGQTVSNGQSLNQGAIELDDIGNTYVINEMGKIIQDNANGTAIEMHSAVSNTLNISGPAASIRGDISGDTVANSVLNISPGAGNSFSYAGNVSNFATFINYTGTAATTGTVNFSGASTNTGTTTVAGGTFNVTNTAGSATGAGQVVVDSLATIGGTGIIQPGLGTKNGVKLAAGSTLVSGGSQSGKTAGAGLTLDNTLSGGAILDASLGTATLAFSLGLNHSATTMTVLGDTANELKFASSDTIAITDLTTGHLTISLNTPYILIKAGTTPDLLADNDLYAGLTTSGGTDAEGNILNGYVTTPIAVSVNGGAVQYPDVGLYLNNGELELVPEPGTWAMMLGGLGVLVFIQLRRRKSQI